jgi:hypothetical protein
MIQDVSSFRLGALPEYKGRWAQLTHVVHLLKVRSHPYTCLHDLESTTRSGQDKAASAYDTFGVGKNDADLGDRQSRQ